MNRLKKLAAALVVAAFTIASASGQTLKVTLLGTGTPILNVNRMGVSILVAAGDQKLLFDAGRGVALRLHQAGVPLRDVDAVFISLMNSDHLTGLADLYASAPLPTDDGRRTKPFAVCGPDGIDNVTEGLRLMLKDNNRLRLLAHETNPGAIGIDTHTTKPGLVYQNGGVAVSAFLIQHGVTKPDYGYRVEYQGHSVVITDDCTYSENLIAHAKAADLMIQSVAIASSELEKADMVYVNHFYSYLANPATAGKIFSESRPKLAVLAHVSLYSRHGIPRAQMSELQSRIAQSYGGRFVIGDDLMSFVVDANGVYELLYDPQSKFKEPS